MPKEITINGVEYFSLSTVALRTGVAPLNVRRWLMRNPSFDDNRQYVLKRKMGKLRVERYFTKAGIVAYEAMRGVRKDNTMMESSPKKGNVLGYIEKLEQGIKIRDEAISAKDRIIEEQGKAIDRLAASMEELLLRLDRIEGKENIFALPGPTVEVPEMTTRENLRQRINDFAKKKNVPYAACWSELYKKSYYMLGYNIHQRAQNAGMSPLDYAEREGVMEHLYSVACKIFA